jgi:predicted MFS family arabinose efflux permease
VATAVRMSLSPAVSAPAPGTPSKRWPQVIWALLVGTFIARAAGFAFPFLSYRLVELGYSTQLVGRTIAVFGVGWLVGQLVCGWLSDRLGRRTTLIGTMLAATATLPVLATAESTVSVVAAAAVVGIVYDAHRPIVSATIQDQIPTEQGRTLVSGWRHFAVNCGAAATGAVGGMLAADTGMGFLFLLNALACAVFALIAALFMPHDKRPSAGRSDRLTYRRALRDVRLWLVCLASLCALNACAAMFTWLPMLMTIDGLDASAYGWTQVATAVVVVLVTPALMPVLSRRADGPTPLIGLFALSSLLLGVGMGAAGFASTTLQYSLAAAAAVTGEVVLFTAASDLVNRISPPEARGLYAGAWGAQLALAVITAPILASWAIETGGDVLAAAVIFTVGLLGAALCLPLRALLHCAAVPDATTA